VQFNTELSMCQSVLCGVMLKTSGDAGETRECFGGGSFDNCTCKRVLNWQKSFYYEHATVEAQFKVIKFEVNGVGIDDTTDLWHCQLETC